MVLFHLISLLFSSFGRPQFAIVVVAAVVVARVVHSITAPYSVPGTPTNKMINLNSFNLKECHTSRFRSIPASLNAAPNLRICI